MPSVTSYQAGLDSSQTGMSYAPETVWATLPATTFQGMRTLSETMKHTKTRTRPAEIRGDRQSAPALTTQENASGNVVFPVFYSTTSPAAASPFDDFISCLVGGDWATPVTIAGVGADVVATWNSGPGTLVLSSATANKFLALANAVGSIVKAKGFTTNVINNGFYRLAAYTSALNITLIPQGFTPVTETPTGTNFNLYYSGLKNGTLFKTLYLQQRLNAAANLWFRYPGCYPTRAQVGLSLGQFLQATFDIAAQQELSAVVDASTGGVVAPPNTKDMDPVSGFKGIYWNDTLLSAAADQFSLDLNNSGAAGQYGLGSALAQGMLGGTFEASGSFRIYIKDMTLYTSFRNETPGVLSIRSGDQAGNQYAFTFPNSTLLLNNGVNTGGPNQSIMGDFSLEASPDTASGATICIDRIPSTA
jgi:hypothetical protein